MAEVFISYAREDQGFARDLNATLLKLQRDTWIDCAAFPTLPSGVAEIFAAIEAADNFLFITSPDSLRSEMCGLEVAHAVANGKRIVTIRLCLTTGPCPKSRVWLLQKSRLRRLRS